MNINWVIVGDSKSRLKLRENNEDICLSALEALNCGMQVVYCIGDSYFEPDASYFEPDASNSEIVIEKQLNELKKVLDLN